MALIAPAFVTINPAFMMPETLYNYSQASGAFNALATGGPLVSLGDGDLAVYIKRIELRSRAGAGQSAYNQLPSATMALSQISTPTYLMRARAEYDHHDTAAAARWGVNGPEAHRLSMWQAHFQLQRLALLYGFNPASGEGLLNAAGITTINLPADSNGNTTVSSYDPGQLAFFFLNLVSQIKVRTNNIGIGRKFCFVGPQEVMANMSYSIVNLVQFQQKGGGVDSTSGLIRSVLMSNGDEIIWAADDTLKGKGAGGTDAILLTMPEIENPVGQRFNTNEFAKLSPGLDATTLMFTDMAAPREIYTPLAGGAIDVLSEIRITSGWPVRPEAVTVLSAGF
jgi:hypothetical protein